MDEYATSVDNSYLGSTVDTQVVRPSVDLTKFNIPKTIKKELVEEKKEYFEGFTPEYIRCYLDEGVCGEICKIKFVEMYKDGMKVKKEE